jgi:ceramide glucosyltransferase
MRDALLPVLGVQAWLGSTFSWRGNDMDLADAVTSN